MADSADEDDQQYEALAYQQRLKAALHYTVGKICEESGEETGLRFSRQFIAALTETTFRQCAVQFMKQDLNVLVLFHELNSWVQDKLVQTWKEKYSKHGRCEATYQEKFYFDHIKGISEEIAAVHDTEKANKKAKKAKKQKKLEVNNHDED